MHNPEHIKLKSCAKINLMLRIVGKRADGYHLIISLMAFLPNIHDELDLTISPANKSPALTIDSIIWDDLKATSQLEPNILSNAYKNLISEFSGRLPDSNYNIKLTKKIPVGAGLGGGSSNAAAFYRYLMNKFHLDEEIILKNSLKTGTDTPFFIRGKAGYCLGVGELFHQPATKIPECYALIVYPNLLLSTQEIFRSYNFKSQAKASELNKHLTEEILNETNNYLQDLDTLANWLATQGNDLTHTAITRYPEIANIIDYLKRQPEILYAGMSGSGSSCFALIATANDSHSVEERSKKYFPNYWIKTSKVSDIFDI